MRLHVDGEVFEVTADEDQMGKYRFDWVSGPVADEGFTVLNPDHAPSTDAELEQTARVFLQFLVPLSGRGT